MEHGQLKSELESELTQPLKRYDRKRINPNTSKSSVLLLEQIPIDRSRDVVSNVEDLGRKYKPARESLLAQRNVYNFGRRFEPPNSTLSLRAAINKV